MRPSRLLWSFQFLRGLKELRQFLYAVALAPRQYSGFQLPEERCERSGILWWFRLIPRSSLAPPFRQGAHSSTPTIVPLAASFLLTRAPQRHLPNAMA